VTKIKKNITEGGFNMKTYIIITVITGMILTGCSSTRTTADYDDVYYSTKAEKKNKKNNNNYETQTTTPDYYTENDNQTPDNYSNDYETGQDVSYEDEPVYSESETIQTPEGTTYITNNYYGDGFSDDYYDYSYAARISRFYDPYIGFSYYSPCYTGFYYDPWYWNNWYYSPSIYFGINWGWGSFGYGYGYPYYPYYSYYGYPYNNSWYGYNDGYWNGYWDGYYGSEYYGYNGYYYGHRPSQGGSNNSGNYNPSNTGANVSPNRADSFGKSTPNINTGGNPGTPEINANSLNTTGKGSALIIQEKTQDSKASANMNKTEVTTKPRYTYKKPASTTTSGVSKYQPGKSAEIQQAQRNVPDQRYSKPSSYKPAENTKTVKQNTNTENKNSQVYSRPQSNYSKSYSKPTKINESSTYSQPNRSSNNTYSQPSRSSEKSYSQPSRSTQTYSTPSRSGSSNSYSAPSRSGSSQSYSTPSRSSSTPTRSSSSSRSTGGRK
jgi:hypothetical protein